MDESSTYQHVVDVTTAQVWEPLPTMWSPDPIGAVEARVGGPSPDHRGDDREMAASVRVTRQKSSISSGRSPREPSVSSVATRAEPVIDEDKRRKITGRARDSRTSPPGVARGSAGGTGGCPRRLRGSRPRKIEIESRKTWGRAAESAIRVARDTGDDRRECESSGARYGRWPSRARFEWRDDAGRHTTCMSLREAETASRHGNAGDGVAPINPGG